MCGCGGRGAVRACVRTYVCMLLTDHREPNHAIQHYIIFTRIAHMAAGKAHENQTSQPASIVTGRTQEEPAFATCGPITCS